MIIVENIINTKINLYKPGGKMKEYNKAIGNYGEELAISYLKGKKYHVLFHSFKCKQGEVDIIAKTRDIICFIEVKSRYNSLYGAPIEAVTYSKRTRIINTARYYLYSNKIKNCNARFDVMELIFNNTNNIYKINHIIDAFR